MSTKLYRIPGGSYPPDMSGLSPLGRIVGAAVKGRGDVLVPGTGPADRAVRNEAGQIVAVTCLKQV